MRIGTVSLVAQRGSRLYGLATANSDYDYFIVHDGRTKQHIFEDLDIVLMNMNRWLRQCARGTPEALEAMFAPNPLVDNLAPLRNAYRAGGPVRETYARTITNFVHYGDFKRKRHALRLALNLRDLMRYGRFNPVMSRGQVAWSSFMARNLDDEVLLRLAFSTAYRNYFRR